MTILGRRRHDAEILDREDIPPAELSASLQLVSEVNRHLGGIRSLRRHLAPLRGREHVRLLDVGTGNADVLRELVRWGGRWWGVGVDLRDAMLRIAAARGDPSTGRLDLVRADGLRLPFPDDAFDASIASLTLHHFPDGDAASLVAEMDRVSRHLVVVSDIERSLAAYLGARILAATRWRGDRITRHDGPLSVRRSFTPREMEALGRRAGLGGVRVHRHFPFRLALVGGTLGRDGAAGSSAAAPSSP